MKAFPRSAYDNRPRSLVPRSSVGDVEMERGQAYNAHPYSAAAFGRSAEPCVAIEPDGSRFARPSLCHNP